MNVKRHNDREEISFNEDGRETDVKREMELVRGETRTIFCQILIVVFFRRTINGSRRYIQRRRFVRHFLKWGLQKHQVRMDSRLYFIGSVGISLGKMSHPFAYDF
ncbi:hypothetical protein EPI10_027117 [Gossypium australe]|uniref:Uncharacterized protein n=1 Tax=Gossypium australe TaxID=47621 RepID=A0A5B6URL4_9ROSI|nr:hypothetical protein EPI10_027117 [Gossypium australe]